MHKICVNICDSVLSVKIPGMLAGMRVMWSGAHQDKISSINFDWPFAPIKQIGEKFHWDDKMQTPKQHENRNMRHQLVLPKEILKVIEEYGIHETKLKNRAATYVRNQLSIVKQEIWKHRNQQMETYNKIDGTRDTLNAVQNKSKQLRIEKSIRKRNGIIKGKLPKQRSKT
jgi:hypothetical protein